MALYAYLCDACGPVEVRLPMGSAGTSAACPSCAQPVRRRYTAPASTRGSTPVARALQRQEASAHEPEVVTAVPHKKQRPRLTTDPRHSRLPRP